jgi:hypothetical protein
MLKYMLDTNICVFTIKNRPQQLRDAFNRHHGVNRRGMLTPYWSEPLGLDHGTGKN